MRTNATLARRLAGALVMLSACGGDDATAPDPTPDTTPPTVALTAPTARTVGGIVTVRAAAEDDRGVAGVQFRLDDANLGSEDTQAPYEIAWDAGAVAEGEYRLSAVARDAAGNATTSAAVEIIVSHTGAIALTSATEGVLLDPDGYTVAVNGETQPQRVGVTGTMSLADLAPGTYTIELADLASHCTVDGDNPRTVVVAAAAAAAETFSITCATPGGGTGRLLYGRIYYNSSESRVKGSLRLTDVDGSDPVDLTDDNSGDPQPAWSPDGSKIAFVSYRDGNDEIYVMNADGSNVVRLTNDPAEDGYPAWSPDGSKIAFERMVSSNKEIFVMNADGTNPVNLTKNAGYDLEPAWSPDGSKIVFSSSRASTGQPWTYELYVMNADGTNPVRLTDDAVSDRWPAWSPDGARILSTKDREGIYVMDADGSDPVRVHQEDMPASWSPDGSKIAFTSGTGRKVAIMDADGRNRTLLEKTGSAYINRPAWQP